MSKPVISSIRKQGTNMIVCLIFSSLFMIFCMMLLPWENWCDNDCQSEKVLCLSLWTTFTSWSPPLSLSSSFSLYMIFCTEGTEVIMTVRVKRFNVSLFEQHLPLDLQFSALFHPPTPPPSLCHLVNHALPCSSAQLDTWCHMCLNIPWSCVLWERGCIQCIPYIYWHEYAHIVVLKFSFCLTYFRCIISILLYF